MEYKKEIPALAIPGVRRSFDVSSRCAYSQGVVYELKSKAVKFGLGSENREEYEASKHSIHDHDLIQFLCALARMVHPTKLGALVL